MAHQNSDSPEDGYFNDLSRQPSLHSNRSHSPPTIAGDGAESGIPRPKRIACIICRKRKLKCDGSKPSCGTCARLGHNCAYDEIRRKSGPKRGYVKELEARLAQVETQLKSKGQSKTAVPIRSLSAANAGMSSIPQPGFQLNDLEIGMAMGDQDMMSGFLDATDNQPDRSIKSGSGNTTQSGEVNTDFGETISWEMIGLGLEEPLPPQDMIDELHQIYFEKLHPSIPMMHKYRYLAALNLAPHMRPAVCLRYSMWSMACSVTEKYFHYQEAFYLRARKYAEIDEMKGHGESFITIGHCQAWSLIATYEFKMMCFPRAWVSAGKATRLAQMMGLHRCDGEALEVKQTLPPPRDWTDREERRRTFWQAYCGDRYASIGTGWPMTIEEKDILTRLPSTEEAYEQSKPQTTLSVSDAMTAEGAASLSPFAAVVVLATLFGRNLTHLHRPDVNDRPDDPTTGEFWKRHRSMDNILTNIAMFLPEHLRLPAGVGDANIVFVNLNIHTSTICLHQAAILKAEKYRLGMDIIKQSTDRCFLAASEIINIMKLITHIDIGSMNPFMSFCLYVAARIYIHAYKKRPSDLATRSNLEFLLTAMQAQRKKNPLSESFLVQLMVDLDGCGVENPMNNMRFSFGLKKAVSEIYDDNVGCPSIMLSHSESQPSHHEFQTSAIKAGQGHPTQQPLDHHGIPGAQYSMNTFSVPTREHRSPRQGYGVYGAPAQGVLPSQNSWAEKFSSELAGNGLHHSNTFDTEMSSDQISDRNNSVSNHPTPATSLHGSSNTSYSPPQHDEVTPENSTGAAAPYYTHSAPFGGYVASSDVGYSHQAGHAIPETEKYPIQAEWELPTDEELPYPSTGMSPLGDAGWRQMLEGMSWDGAPLGPDTSWRPPQTNAHDN